MRKKKQLGWVLVFLFGSLYGDPSPWPSTIERPQVEDTTPSADYPYRTLPTPRAIQRRSAPTEEATRPIPPPRAPQLNLPLYAPPGEHAVHPSYVVPVTPETQMQRMEAQSYRSSGGLPPPQQGYLSPLDEYQRPQMQTEHHDYLMSQPQPQVNPPGPRVYQLPGDYSTLPGS